MANKPNKTAILMETIVPWTSRFVTVIVALAVMGLLVAKRLGLWEASLSGKEAPLTLYLLCSLVVMIALHRWETTVLRSHSERVDELLQTMSQIGVANVWLTDDMPRAQIPSYPDRWLKLDIVAMTANSWLIQNKRRLIGALEAGCDVRVLVAGPKSSCAAWRGKFEGENRAPHVVDEIHSVGHLIADLRNEVGERMRGSIEIRHSDADIPSRVEIVNQAFYHWTPYLPPHRSVESPSFDIVRDKHGAAAANLLDDYFSAMWEAATSPEKCAATA